MLPASGDEMRTALPPGKSTHEGEADPGDGGLELACLPCARSHVGRAFSRPVPVRPVTADCAYDFQKDADLGTKLTPLTARPDAAGRAGACYMY